MNKFTAFCYALAFSLLFPLSAVTAAPASAATELPATMIDDFDDGDASDWGFFGGNNAGGGGGTLDDRPQQGSHYFSTGWGGEGTASGFYGGAFKNLDNAAQVTPPADPWLNVWVLNQSDATVDGYTLELTIREDLNGDGWTDGSEDSFRLDAPFTASDFDDEWRLISAPLSSLVDLGTGGNGVFDGALDEVVIVIAGVTGGSGAVVEVDFDEFSFTSGGPRFGAVTIFDNMEHGNPFGNGWFSFNGSVGGGGIGPNSTDLPPSNGGLFSLETGWGSGGVAGFYGGFGRTNPLSLEGNDHFNFWINPDAGQVYTLEIGFQEDDNGDGAINPSDDDDFKFNCVIGPSGPCAVSGGGWQLVSIPFADLFDDNSLLTGGNGVFDPVAVAEGGNGELINVVYAVIGGGSDANFRTDYWVFSDGPLAQDQNSEVVDDFENGLPAGSDANGTPIGFYTFSDGSPIGIVTTTAPPAPLPGSVPGNTVLSMTANVAAFAGFIHAFENAAVDTWVTRDWSGFQGFSLWFYGTNSGTAIFIDVLDNRTPGSTRDDAERFSVAFTDDFSGWRQLEFPFESFVRKEIGNGAPNDGFTLTEVHGWTLGSLGTSGEVTWYVDDAALYGTAEIPPLSVSFDSGGYGIEEGTTGLITVKLNRPMNSDDPEQVSVEYNSAPLSAVPGEDYAPVAGTLVFTRGGATEQSFALETFDNTKFLGNRSISLTLDNPVDVAPGLTTLATALVVENDPFDLRLLDDFEDPPALWESSDNVVLTALRLAADDPLARPGQDPVEGVLQVEGPQPVSVEVRGGVCQPNGKPGRGLAQFALLTTDSFDALSVDHTTVTLGDAREFHTRGRNDTPLRHEKDVDKDGDLDLVFHFRGDQTGLPCDTTEWPLAGTTYDGTPITSGGSDARFGQDFALGRDWSDGESLSFWVYGSGSGVPVTVELKDNRAPDPGPAGWELTFSEEFNDPAGTRPNPDIWTYEIGDGSVNGIPGWANDELQYYTDDLANAATDGQGNMVLSVLAADGSLRCYYGPCEYSSARLISKRKAEFAYGRVEARVLVPEGVGIWPSFWSLGTDIDVVNQPQAGEIDFVEFVGRLPNEIFGTIQGPGYSGGNAFGSIFDFGEPVYNDYRTFVVEWEPDLIRWYVDGNLYHTATPGDVAPNEWVFNDPVFLLLNVAIGGNFGGAVDPDIPLPASMAVDYIRIYQAGDTAERFEATFVDDVAGWRQVQIPFADFVRRAGQPVDAPDDGLTLTEVWGYGFELPRGGSFLLDQVRVEQAPAPAEVTVTSLADSGVGSLRDALTVVADGGTITFDPGLAGGTLALTSGQLVVDRSVTVDGSAAPGLVISGNLTSRVIEVAGGATLRINDLTIADGAGAPQGGGILNRGRLDLERVVVRDNTETSAGPANFEFGGGGIYNAADAVLNLTDSTVSGNSSVNQPGGGIYGFFGSAITITGSTISDNVSGDIGGGLRTFSNATVVNSTSSGNVSTVWHGGGIFHTDGDLTVTHSTFAGNVAPGGTASAILVATFGAPASATLTGNILEGIPGSPACAIEGGGAATITSAGGNIDVDNSCKLVAAGDQPATNPQLGALADNGGGTLTHLPAAGSPAIDAAAAATCPGTDQRGVVRPQGAGCDVGAVELSP